jgi:hypothetical protein
MSTPPPLPPQQLVPPLPDTHDRRVAAERARLAIIFALVSVALLVVPAIAGSRYHNDMPPSVGIKITLAVLAGIILNIMGAVFGVLCLRAKPRSNLAIIGACFGLGSLVGPLAIAIIVASLFK